MRIFAVVLKIYVKFFYACALILYRSCILYVVVFKFVFGFNGLWQLATNMAAAGSEVRD